MGRPSDDKDVFRNMRRVYPLPDNLSARKWAARSGVGASVLLVGNTVSTSIVPSHCTRQNRARCVHSSQTPCPGSGLGVRKGPCSILSKRIVCKAATPSHEVSIASDVGLGQY